MDLYCEYFTLHCTAPVKSHFKYFEQLQVSQYKEDIKLIECVHRRAVNMVENLEGKTCNEWLRSLGMFSGDKRWLTDLVMVYNFLRQSSREGTDLSLGMSNRT